MQSQIILKAYFFLEIFNPLNPSRLLKNNNAAAGNGTGAIGSIEEILPLN